MTTGHVFIATSLDGFIARCDGDLDWLMEYGSGVEDHQYTTMIDSVDGLVMGTNTFQKILSLDKWPYEKPVIVMSNSLKETDIPKYLLGHVRLSNAAPRTLMEDLNGDGWSRAYVDGGKIIQSFLLEELIEDIILTTVPILIGNGISLFGKILQDIHLTHLETNTFASGMVTSKYQVVRNSVK